MSVNASTFLGGSKVLLARSSGKIIGIVVFPALRVVGSGVFLKAVESVLPVS
jgi:hypothetical protein